MHEPIFDGLGNLHHPVTTKTNPALAQQFFDQGLTFIYAFNLDEAADSFRQAAQYDPDMAMAYWGIALSLGPNINEPEDTDRGKMAYAAITKAKSLEANATEPEREYIDALAMRYASDGKMTDAQQLAYANAMREVARKNPDDPDAGTLFAESMMDLHPWQLWTLDGKPVAGTPEIVATLEGVIAKYPDHIGANHYYIHAVEASSDPGRALPSAQRLPKLAPAAGHIVHMPSHIYFRIGDYDASVNANLAAIKADKVYLRERNPKGMFTMNYVAHNEAFLWASYMMEGNSRGAFKASRAARRRAAARAGPPDADGGRRVALAIFHRGSLRQVGRDSQRACAAGGPDLHDRNLALRARPRVRGEESSSRCAEGTG